MTRPIALISTLLVLAFAAPAAAQSGAFGPLPAAEPTATATATPSAADSGETKTSVLIIIAGALIIGFGVMGFLIARDARRKSPEIAMAAGPALADGGVGARKPHNAAAKKKMRQKTRAQKQARKAHRKR